MEDSREKAYFKLLEMKVTVFEMKNTLDGINSRLDIIEENSGDHGDRAIETLQNNTHSEINLKDNNNEINLKNNKK